MSDADDKNDSMNLDPLEQEDEFVGEPRSLVPTKDPGEYCFGKRWEGKDEENRQLFAGYCRLAPGFGTDHVGEGRCKFHGGAGGPPANNQNAQKHALTADPHHYHENLEQEEKQFVEDVSAAIEDRLRRVKGEKPDYLDRVLARRVAVKLHMVCQASDYTENVAGLVQTVFTEDGTYDEKTPLVEEIRRFDESIFRNLKDLGVLDDPESQKADALESWREFVNS